jgi:uncharacterized protein YndB with AHSA1/START domain
MGDLTPKRSSETPQVNPTADGVVGRVLIRAQPQVIFRALTDPNQLVQWWGSKDTYWVTSWESDLCLGGRWSCEGQSVRGDSFTVEGHYTLIDPPHRLGYTWNSSWRPGVETRVEYTLEEEGSGTLVTVRHAGMAGKPEAIADFLGGLPSVLGWLQGFAEEARSLAGGRA